MKKRLSVYLLVVPALLVAAAVRVGAASGTDDAGVLHSSAMKNGGVSATQAEADRLTEELKKLQEGLLAKRKEAARLHRKWVVTKGRMPGKDELADFEKKRVKGEVPIGENPYVNKSPLSSPGLYRRDYFLKAEEIKRDEEHVGRLQNEINALNHRQ
jgi:hypothetical protein